MAIQHITHFTLYVKNQDECLAWYQEKLGFIVCEDNSQLVNNFRWLTISPALDKSTQFVLMPTNGKEDERRIGKNGMCVLTSDNCESDCMQFSKRGVEIVQSPESLPWGLSAIIKDLYGNFYNLVELRRQ
ncbi:MAG: VOC family protein [Thiohalomonadales bacterium]